jgi:glycosyltransferase involved in cell wall biosynthesis
MRILYAVTGAGFGGAPVHVLHLIEADLNDGHEVGLVTAPEPRIVSEARRLGATVFPNPHFVRRVRLVDDIRALWAVVRYIRQYDPDIVSAHSTKAGLAARFAGAILRKPVVFTAHGWAFGEGRSGWQRATLALMERLAAVVTAKIICVSEYDRSIAQRRGIAPARKLTLIHNGVEPGPFLIADSERVRAELGLGQNTVVTMIGRLAPPKDPLTLVAACQLLKGDPVLLLVGDGELRGAVEHSVSSLGLGRSVLLAGERTDIPEVLAASDVFVLSSCKEGLPYTVIEAMVAGLPVVASRVGGVPELVEDGVTGFLVPPRDPRALVGALQKVLDDPGLRSRMGTAGREKAIREFGLAEMVRKTHHVYDEVLRRSQ